MCMCIIYYGYEYFLFVCFCTVFGLLLYLVKISIYHIYNLKN